MGTANPSAGTRPGCAHPKLLWPGRAQKQALVLEAPESCFRRSRIQEDKGATTEVQASMLCSSKDDKVMHTGQEGTFSK